MGEVSGLMMAAVIMFICTIALAGVLSNISTNYGVNTTDDVQSLIDTANASTGTIAGWTLNSSQSATQNDFTSQIIWITSGGLSVLSSMMALPMVFHAIFVSFINAVMLPLGVDSSFVGVMVSGVYTIIFMVFVFAALKAVFKVDL